MADAQCDKLATVVSGNKLTRVATVAKKQNKGSAVAEMGNHTRVKWTEKSGAVPLLVGAAMDPHLTQCRLDQGLPPFRMVT